MFPELTSLFGKWLKLVKPLLRLDMFDRAGYEVMPLEKNIDAELADWLDRIAENTIQALEFLFTGLPETRQHGVVINAESEIGVGGMVIIEYRPYLKKAL